MELPQGVELGTDGDTAESAMLDDVDDASSDNTSFTERDIDDVWEDVLGEEGGSSWDADIADVTEHSLAGKE